MSEISFTNKIQVIAESPEVRGHHRNDFVSSFRLIHIVSRIFGLMPFSIVCQANGDIDRPTVTKFDILWFLISMCVYSFGIFTLSQLIFPRGSNIYASYLVVLSDNITITLGLVLGFFAIVFDMNNRSKLVGIVKKISIFDKKVFEISNFPTNLEIGIENNIEFIFC